MAIYRRTQSTPLGPEELTKLGTAYERTLQALGLCDRNDPITEIVAKKLLALYETGICDPIRLSAVAVEDLLT